MIDPTSILEMIWHDPLLIVAFLFLSLNLFFSTLVFLKLIRAGCATDYLSVCRLMLTAPLSYLRVRHTHGWSAWPAHMIWVSAILGMCTLFAGLFRLLRLVIL